MQLRMNAWRVVVLSVLVGIAMGVMGCNQEKVEPKTLGDGNEVTVEDIEGVWFLNDTIINYVTKDGKEFMSTPYTFDKSPSSQDSKDSIKITRDSIYPALGIDWEGGMLYVIEGSTFFIYPNTLGSKEFYAWVKDKEELWVLKDPVLELTTDAQRLERLSAMQELEKTYIQQCDSLKTELAALDKESPDYVNKKAHLESMIQEVEEELSFIPWAIKMLEAKHMGIYEAYVYRRKL